MQFASAYNTQTMMTKSRKSYREYSETNASTWKKEGPWEKEEAGKREGEGRGSDRDKATASQKKRLKAQPFWMSSIRQKHW